MEKADEYERRMHEVQVRKQLVVEKIKLLLEEYNKLECEEDNLKLEEFVRTGIATFSFDVTLSITEQDMLKDLVKRTEGMNIMVNKPREN